MKDKDMCQGATYSLIKLFLDFVTFSGLSVFDLPRVFERASWGKKLDKFWVNLFYMQIDNIHRAKICGQWAATSHLGWPDSSIVMQFDII